MPYDAVNMADWQISEAAEPNMPTPDEWCDKLGLKKEEMLPMGRLGKLDFLKIIDRLKDKPDGKYIEVTAITPTPLGDGGHFDVLPVRVVFQAVDDLEKIELAQSAHG